MTTGCHLRSSKCKQLRQQGAAWMDEQVVAAKLRSPEAVLHALLQCVQLIRNSHPSAS
jgi:hypothetical protein